MARGRDFLVSAGVVAAIGAAAICGGATPRAAASIAAHASRTCSDYSNQRDAQLNRDTRDADGDGIYCEMLPCPCLRGGGGGGTGRGQGSPVPVAPRRTQEISARITSVVDGDTIKVHAFSASRRFYTVRLIGIDTPETKRPGTPIECGGRGASSHMLRLAFSSPEDLNGDGIYDAAGGEGRRVTLRTDPSQDLFDQYGRLLAYVVTRTGVDLGRSQIAAGYAKVYVFERAFRELGLFRSAQGSARVDHRGVWGHCGGDFHRPAR